MGSLTTGGLHIAVEDGALRIVQEGRVRKLVDQVSHLSFNGPYTASRGTPVVYITERAVLEMRANAQGEQRLTVVELAPGIDLQRDVLAHCAGPLEVAADLRTMEAGIFQPRPWRLT